MGLRTETKAFLLRSLNRKKTDEEFAKWESLYGPLDQGDYEHFSISDLPSESGIYHGEIIKWARDEHPKHILFAGENIETASLLQEVIEAEKVFTAGLIDTDFLWDFEKDAPDIEEHFDLIISQAILEHLLNPYKHLEDLSNLLPANGHLIIHSVMPGFPYHRHPIDSLRFFPDWFEEVAKRLGMKTVRKKIRDTHIFYMYQKR